MVTRVDLDRTVGAQWWRGFAISRGLLQTHWQTRIAYYEAVIGMIDRGDPLTWQVVVDCVVPRGSRTTFYAMAGETGRRRLWCRYAGAEAAYGAEIAYCYRRGTATDRLADEAKVWSYWPYRDQVLDTLEITADPAQHTARIEASIQDWVRDNGALATYLDHAPPMCAVEDLALAWPGGLAATRAFNQLREQMRVTANQPRRADPGSATAAAPAAGEASVITEARAISTRLGRRPLAPVG